MTLKYHFHQILTVHGSAVNYHLNQDNSVHIESELQLMKSQVTCFLLWTGLNIVTQPDIL